MRLGLPFSRLHVPDIQAEVLNCGLVAQISGTTIWRWLAEDAIKPWTHRSWIFPRASAFESKAGRALDLYARQFEGRQLKPDEFVISADEKTSIQARIRCHPSVAATAHHPMLVEHEYDRGGALAYIAAWDVHRAKLFGSLAPKTGIAPFDSLVGEVMGEEPYRSARASSWIVDNGSSHRGAAAIKRLQSAHPNLVLVHLPIHAIWLNQVEIYFSILQRKVLTPADDASLSDLGHRILAFQAAYEVLARPFEMEVHQSRPLSPPATPSVPRIGRCCVMEYITELPCRSTSQIAKPAACPSLWNILTVSKENSVRSLPSEGSLLRRS